MSEPSEKRKHFIRQLINNDLTEGKHSKVITRFPPEPNGYLHIGHAKSICLNFGLAQEFNGDCHLRFDDTNPIKEEEEFVHAIMDDVQWLGFTWDGLYYCSDYYQQLFDYALVLIDEGKAYVDSLSFEDIKLHRGTLQQPGKDSPYRSRSIAENKDLFLRMQAGEFKDGTHVLRAKIDMQSPNINLRDPVLYRIRHVAHQRTGTTWCIYPLYDYAHPLSDAIEKITHSLCTLEFQDHRPLYDWFINHLSVPAKPIQTEFARLNLSHTVTSKRKLRQLVEDKIVDSWNDPRLPTIQGMRKRGYPAAAIREFCEQIGISKSDSVIDMSILEACVRDELNQQAKRALAVLDPIKVILDNYPEDQVERYTVAYAQNNPELGTRSMPFGKELYIERSDFMQEPSKGYFRLSPGQEVRLRHAYVVRCEKADYDEKGNLIAVHCTYDPETLGKNPVDRKVKGVIHWVYAKEAHPITVIQYDRLFTDPNPAREDDFLQFINPNSLTTVKAMAEPALAQQTEGELFQFERLGYYCVNTVTGGKAEAYHRVVSLKDTWSNQSQG